MFYNKLSIGIINRIKSLSDFYYLDRYSSKISRFFVLLLRRPFIKKTKNITVTKYCLENNIKTTIEQTSKIKSVYLPSFVNSTRSSSKISVKTPEIFSCILENVFISPKNNFIISRDFKYCLDERLSWPEEDLIKYCRQSICIKHTKNFSYIEKNMENKTIKEAIPLCFAGSTNYYHFMFDVIGSCAYIRNKPNLKNVPVILSESLEKMTSFVSLLKLVLGENHPILFLKNQKIYKVEKLYYFSPCSWYPVFNLKKECDFINPDSQHFLKYAKNQDVVSMYRDLVKLSKDVKIKFNPKKIFITRKNKNRIINENELAQIAKTQGYEIIDCSEFSILEQIYIFSHAEVVIADYGAGCANIVYCNPKCRFYIFTPSNRIDYIFSTTGYEVGVNNYCILTEPYNYELKRSFEPDEFKRILKNIDKTH